MGDSQAGHWIRLLLLHSSVPAQEPHCKGSVLLSALLPQHTVPLAPTFCCESHNCSEKAAGMMEPHRRHVCPATFCSSLVKGSGGTHAQGRRDLIVASNFPKGTYPDGWATLLHGAAGQQQPPPPWKVQDGHQDKKASLAGQCSTARGCPEERWNFCPCRFPWPG